MNSSNRKLRQHTYEDSSEETTSGSTSDQKSLSDHPGYVNSRTVNAPKKIVYSTNNDVMENYARNLKNTQGNNNNNIYGTNNYSTIDSKKFIKTENGLVYTPLNGGILKKSTDALMSEDDPHLDSKYRLEEPDYEDLRMQRNYSKIASTYSNVKKTTQAPITNKDLFGGAPIEQDNFKNELNLKLKSFNTNGDQGKQYQMEQISTATTSLSSASSCTSNTELVKDSRRLAPLANNLTESMVSSNGTLQGGNNGTSSTYSLLKTTLNVKGANETLDNSLAMSQLNGNGSNTLRKSQNKLNAACAAKPPILKPKPKGNAYQANPLNNKKQTQSGYDVHNSSGDPLVMSNFKETSLSASPCTSVTDVSSNNLTPQHNNGHLVEDITASQINSLVKPSIFNGQRKTLNQNGWYSS